MSFAKCADLEISLSREHAGLYAVDLRCTLPDSDADVRLATVEPNVVRFELEKLAELQLRPDDYGVLLRDSLCAARPFAEAFASAEAAAAAQDAPLRLRLLIGADAAELHGLRWELLRLPSGAPVGASERVLFSRYLASSDWQPVPLLPRAGLRALVVIANPDGLADYSLAALDVAAERARVRGALAGIELVELTAPGQANLAAIADALRGGVEILYLVAHGAWRRGESMLWLEDAAGKVALTPGAALVARVAALAQRPRLVVLASCQSAGGGREGDAALAGALGPALARAGVAAVVAMQGNFSVATAEAMLPRFFTELGHHGQVDRALALARAQVQDRGDWWMPALFMRLRSGRIWYVPGFGGEGEEFERWPALLRSIRTGRCTPVVGPTLSESLYGSARDLALEWAESFHFPLAATGRSDLAQVAQFLAVTQTRSFPRSELLLSLRRALRRRYPQALAAGDEEAEEADDVSGDVFDEALTRVADWRAAQGLFDPYAVLAGLPCPLFVTAAHDSLLLRRLQAAGKQPVQALCPWRKHSEADPKIADGISAQQPLVFHVFGHHSDESSVVLTEDDVYDFLIGVTRERDQIPPRVRAALVDSALLFLGFSVDDWKFRVFFRSLMDQAGGGLRQDYAHVAAQIDPEGGDVADPERARRYLASYFKGAEITIFWGTADDFLRQLSARMSAAAAKKGARP